MSAASDLADLEAIRDLARRYAHYVWQNAVERLADLFAEDGEMDPGTRPPLRGRAALAAGFREMLTAGSTFLPFVQQHVVDLAGDVASGICYVDLRAEVEGTSMIGAGWYDDRYVRAADEWRFQSRRITLRFFVPLADGWSKKLR
ncbi:MAG: nuclear transport factor 2 family protein [Myxococcales bacterium]|jgi:ketosteroid isomerase-like protein|nr:nuclear transport factor 2 family protein [Myxococcales bacterium]